MLQIDITHPDGASQSVQVDDDCVIGKSAQCELRLDSWRVGKEHARLCRTPAGVLLDDLGTFGGVSVNGQRVSSQHGPLKASDEIRIAGYSLRVTEIGTLGGVVQAAHPRSRSDTAATRNREATETLLESRLLAEAAQRKALEERDAQRAQARSVASAAAPAPAVPPSYGLVLAPDPALKQREFEWRRRVHSKLLETMDLRRHDVSSMSDETLRKETEQFIRQILRSLKSELPADLNEDLLCRQVLDEAVGLGPLEDLLADESVSEVMVNRFDEIYVERGGRLTRHPLTFTGDRAVLGVIERIVAPLGRRIDESSPMVDARLKDGSRVNAIIPPLALKGACLTIRKFSKRKLGAQDLVRFGAISPAMASFLEICVKARKNMIVSGGTGSGKTTLLNILSNFIPAGERVITVEDAAELKLDHEHLISLESRPANVEGKGAVYIRDLVKNTLRMRPDRIVVGECRGAEALDMLQAMNTGHEGSLTTLHANTPRDGLARLETMVLMAGMDLPLTAIREQVTSAVDLIVQQTRFSCGTRMVTSITEVAGMESGKIQLQELFRFHNQGYIGPEGRVQGWFEGCDLVPSFYEELRATGHALDMDIFKSGKPALAAQA
ncbi:pilus assembly protein CpaF [Paucibacter oligotrophus]|uniref:Pilus assembly protein CpaF n=1 Tax=Roseateles oligotrophus TaxID=1769250 RepID=A0A840L4A7_9BURK|nr:ATPase, T2SS/T4P/T4SS family [Roseateles oligotrophus]MBB4842631.1 pilus assembly protein CpaF [Roseateles oligotrophus]